jgi:membrane-bound lytic murein transglycosylase D
LTKEKLRGIRTSPLLAALLLAACAHTPPAKPPLPAPVVQIPSPDSQTTETAAVAADSAASEPSVPQPVAGITPEQYADLFDRIRAGFKLDDVDRAAVDQQLNWFASNPDYLDRAFGRAELYLYHIVTEIERRGMPLELALLPVIESAFEPYAYSHSSAMGLWQFIPGTGSRFGLKQNWWYDGRRDVVESTRAALDYLQSLHDEFNGDWLLAVAAYNCGEVAVERAVQLNQEAGRPIDFWSLRLPAETRAYVPKLLAMKRLVADPESFGLAFTHISNQPYFSRVDTQGQIDLRVAAEIAGVTYDEVYELNPAFHRWATDPSGPNFLLLPSDSADAFRANVVQLTADERLKVRRYTVHSGDSVASVAHRFNTTIQVVRQLNDLPNGALVVGAELRVPAEAITLPPKVLHAAALVDSHDRRVLRPHLRVVVHRGDSLWAIARRHGVDVNTLALMNGLQPGDALRAGQHLRLAAATPRSSGGTSTAGAATEAPLARKVTYTVRNGDTLARIARVFQVTVAQIKGWNSLSAGVLWPGQRLLIRVAQR